MFRLADIDRDEDSIIELHSLCFDYKTQMAPLLFALDDDRVFLILYAEDEEPSGYIVCRITDEKSTFLYALTKAIFISALYYLITHLIK